MALDTLQIPATIINNDKLVSMYGSLLAKKKADQDAHQKLLIDQMAKIDATGIRAVDTEDYTKMYNDYVKFGTDNIKNLSDPAVQVSLKQQENRLKGFINLSKAGKEEDVKVLAFTSPDYDDNTRKSANMYTQMPTLKRTGTFDYTQTKKVDTKDYINEIAKGIDPKVIITQGNFKLTNPEVAYPQIQSLIEDNIRAQSNTLTGKKALAQFAVDSEIDLSTDNGKEQAIKELSKAVFGIKKASLDKSMVEFGKQKEESDSKEAARLGYNPKNVPVMQFNADLAVQVAKGDPKALEKLKQMSLQNLEFKDNGWTVDVIDTSTNKVIQVLDRKQKPAEFSEQMLSFLNRYGMDAGIKQVGLGEYRNFLLSKDKKYYTSAKTIKGTAADKAVRANKAGANKSVPGNKPSSSLLGTTVIIKK